MRLHSDYEANKCPVGVRGHYERVETSIVDKGQVSV